MRNFIFICVAVAALLGLACAGSNQYAPVVEIERGMPGNEYATYLAEKALSQYDDGDINSCWETLERLNDMGQDLDFFPKLEEVNEYMDTLGAVYVSFKTLREQLPAAIPYMASVCCVDKPKYNFLGLSGAPRGSYSRWKSHIPPLHIRIHEPEPVYKFNSLRFFMVPLDRETDFVPCHPSAEGWPLPDDPFYRFILRVDQYLSEKYSKGESGATIVLPRGRYELSDKGNFIFPEDFTVKKGRDSIILNLSPNWWFKTNLVVDSVLAVDSVLSVPEELNFNDYYTLWEIHKDGRESRRFFPYGRLKYGKYKIIPRFPLGVASEFSVRPKDLNLSLKPDSGIVYIAPGHSHTPEYHVNVK